MSTFDSNHGDDQTSLMPDNHNYDMNSQNIPKPEDDRKLFVGKSFVSLSLCVSDRSSVVRFQVD
jgi:hypothetical protein